ncbi:MAG: hypothetical protein RLZZ628_1213 [Bacteroidota bacterium]
MISNFYNRINDELTELLAQNPSDERTKAHKNPIQNRSYAMLIWFLKFYGQKGIYQSFITDGLDDKSCDIIFSNKSVQEEVLFYVVQSKYVHFDASKKAETEFPKMNKTEFGHALNDFAVILNGTRWSSKNKNFNRKYEELKQHLEKNGKVKFLFFTLADDNPEIEEAVHAFNQTYAPHVTLEVIDFQRIRRDYIEFKYKEITTSNPLEYAYRPEEQEIILPIERLKNSKRDIFEFDEPAYIFLVKPKTVYDLFNKYKFSLFFKNVRNPLHRSNYNPKIVETLLKKPAAFWYFNNGITGITQILPSLGVHAKEIRLEGLQIINGAQTIYSIFSAYQNATVMQRKVMDNYARIALRLIGSGDEAFNLQITRYTNMQNPMENRDFCANDDVQQRLQNESFATDIWYEKRRSEFRLDALEKKQLGIAILSNIDLVAPYLAFYLQKPMDAATRENDFFVARKEDKDGLYETIFNEQTKYEDLYAAYFVARLYDEYEYMPHKTLPSQFQKLSLFAIALSKIVMQKYFALTRWNESGKVLNLSLYLLNLNKSRKAADWATLLKILVYAALKIMELSVEQVGKLTTNASFYDTIVEKLEDTGMDIAAIQAIEIKTKF